MLTFTAASGTRAGRGTALAAAATPRPEWFVAAIRICLATSALLIVWFAPTTPAAYAPAAFSLLATYTLFAALMPFAVQLGGAPSRLIAAVLAIDVSFAAAITASTGGPGSLFFPFFLLAPLSAACRWGGRETILTSGIVAAALSLEALAVGKSTPFSLGLVAGDFDPTAAITHAVYIVVAAVFLAVLAAREKHRRSEAAIIASVVDRAGTAAGLEGAVESTLGVVLRTFSADRALLAMRHAPTDRVFLWDAAHAAGGGEPVVVASELTSEQREWYLFDVPGASWHASRYRFSDWFDLLAFDVDGNRLSTGAFTLPASLLAGYRCQGALGISIAFGREWAGRLLLIDPHVGSNREAAVRRAQRMGREIGPAANQEYLLALLRARAVGEERARLARELHDTVVQTLIAAQMDLEVIGRRSMNEAPQFAGAVARLKDMLTAETVNLRELTHRLKSVDTTPRALAGLTEVVARFERDTGIATRFCSDGGLSPSPRSSNEVVHILQEGLANVYKHSGARHVLVRAGAHDGRFRLSIEDDGRGFPFSGRLSHAELAAAREGPAVMMERVRALGGEITVESKAGQGARVEVAVPL